MFGIKKIIFGTAGINEPLNDKNGEYGMTEHAMAIKYNTETEANNIIKCLKSDKFLDLINACNWSSFLLDWRLFTYFKKNFYLEFINDDNNSKTDEIITVSKKKTLKLKIENKITNEDKEIEKFINDEFNNLKISKKKALKANIIINDDNKN